MDAILQFLIDWGYWGLFLGSFIAGSVLPFSSEAVLAACVGPLGLDPVISIAAATRRQCCRRHDLLLDGTSGQYGMDREIFSCKKREDGPCGAVCTRTGCLDGFLRLYPYFGKCHIHCIRHDACQYMDCHSRYDHRKDTPLRLIGMGGIGSLRFNALKL
mgnify:FL=1